MKFVTKRYKNLRITNGSKTVHMKFTRYLAAQLHEKLQRRNGQKKCGPTGRGPGQQTGTRRTQLKEAGVRRGTAYSSNK